MSFTDWISEVWNCILEGKEIYTYQLIGADIVESTRYNTSLIIFALLFSFLVTHNQEHRLYIFFCGCRHRRFRDVHKGPMALSDRWHFNIDWDLIEAVATYDEKQKMKAFKIRISCDPPDINEYLSIERKLDGDDKEVDMNAFTLASILGTYEADKINRKSIPRKSRNSVTRVKETRSRMDLPNFQNITVDNYDDFDDEENSEPRLFIRGGRESTTSSHESSHFSETSEIPETLLKTKHSALNMQDATRYLLPPRDSKIGFNQSRVRSPRNSKLGNPFESPFSASHDSPSNRRNSHDFFSSDINPRQLTKSILKNSATKQNDEDHDNLVKKTKSVNFKSVSHESLIPTLSRERKRRSRHSKRSNLEQESMKQEQKAQKLSRRSRTIKIKVVDETPEDYLYVDRPSSFEGSAD